MTIGVNLECLRHVSSECMKAVDATQRDNLLASLAFQLNGFIRLLRFSRKRPQATILDRYCRWRYISILYVLVKVSFGPGHWRVTPSPNRRLKGRTPYKFQASRVDPLQNQQILTK